MYLNILVFKYIILTYPKVTTYRDFWRLVQIFEWYSSNNFLRGVSTNKDLSCYLCTCLFALMQVTWSQATSPVLERNITEVVPTSLRLNTVYIEVKTTNKWDTLLYNNKRNNLQVYINWLYLIFLYLTPISILIIFNIRIYR